MTKNGRWQRSGIHTKIPHLTQGHQMGKWQKHKKTSHTREPLFSESSVSQIHLELASIYKNQSSNFWGFVLSVHYSLVVTCWERASLLALLYVMFSCHFPMWCLGLGVVLDCIDSWSLPSSLLCNLYRRISFPYFYYNSSIKFRIFSYPSDSRKFWSRRSGVC